MKHTLRLFVLVWLTPILVYAAEPEPPQNLDYAKQIAPLFRKYCVGCHNTEDAFTSADLVLESFPKLMKGSENGAVIVPGQPDKSKLILVLEKKTKPFMPPKDKKGPTDEEIALLKSWIKAGAKGPAEPSPLADLSHVPHIKPTVEVRQPIHAVAYAPDGKHIAVARYGRVEIRSTDTQKAETVLEGHTGNVNAVGFSADGTLLFAAAGQPALFGEATLWSTADWTRLRTIRGHHDSLYAAALSPDGKILATGGYDQAIKLWDVATGKELNTLQGHNGAVFDLAFHPTKPILASASGDRTVKLWNVSTGERLDTLNEPTKEQYTVAFSPDGRFLAAGGVDNRIRVWEIQQDGREGTNPIRYARFAHEQPILKLAFSPDGRVLVSSGQDGTVKLWETGEFTQQRALTDQSDWSPALAVAPDSSALLVGRLDGTLSTYRLADGSKGAQTAAPINEVPLPASPQEPPPSKWPQVTETEPNDVPDQATPIPAPGIATGVLMPNRGTPYDADLYRFDCKQGETWVVETFAARQKSPADTRIEVLHADGTPVLRYLMRATRDSYITFRPINSDQTQVRVKNWQEMKLNQFMYLNGEVCKIIRMPQGPDSGILFYSNRDKRECYFDTSATVHANGDPVYIVEPYAPGTELSDNGLPVFPLDYSNDDDGERELGADSRLTFTAPSDGTYLVRVTDVRGFGGREFKYSLALRKPRPNFQVSLKVANVKIGAGSGQRLTVRVDRIDHFNGDIRVDLTGMPPGFHVSTPIVVESGHLEAEGVINVDPDVPPTLGATGSLPAGKAVSQTKNGRPAPAEAPEPLKPPDWSQVKVTATATINGKDVVNNVASFGDLTVGPKPPIIVTLEADRPVTEASPSDRSDELVIVPGTTITAMLRIERNGFDGELKFDVDNLPHGVIVDNIGLNGILIREKENERQIFLTAEDWVPETTRWVDAVAQGEGNQASRPIRLHVRASDRVAKANGQE